MVWPTRRQSQRQRHADRHKDFDDFVDTDKDKDKDIGNDLVIQWLSYTIDYFWQIEKLLPWHGGLVAESDLDSIRNSCDI